MAPPPGPRGAAQILTAKLYRRPPGPGGALMGSWGPMGIYDGYIYIYLYIYMIYTCLYYEYISLY